MQQIDEMITNETYRTLIAYCNDNNLTIEEFLRLALKTLKGE